MRYWRRVATIYLALSLPKESSGQPGLGPDTKLPLLGLAPGGVYLVRRCFHLRGELLPHLFTLTIYQRLFSVALSVGAPRPVVNGHLAGGARTFLRSIHSELPGGRPVISPQYTNFSI